MDALEECEICQTFNDKNINNVNIQNQQLKFQYNSLYGTVININSHNGRRLR